MHGNISRPDRSVPPEGKGIGMPVATRRWFAAKKRASADRKNRFLTALRMPKNA